MQNQQKTRKQEDKHQIAKAWTEINGASGAVHVIHDQLHIRKQDAREKQERRRKRKRGQKEERKEKKDKKRDTKKQTKGTEERRKRTNAAVVVLAIDKVTRSTFPPCTGTPLADTQ